MKRFKFRKIVSLAIATTMLLTVGISSFATSQEDNTEKSKQIYEKIVRENELAKAKSNLYSYNDMINEFDNYFSKEEKYRILSEFNMYIDKKIINDGKKTTTDIKKQYSEKYAVEFVQYAVNKDIIKVKNLNIINNFNTNNQSVRQVTPRIGLIQDVRMIIWTATWVLQGLGYTYTGEMLRNSCPISGNPSPLFYYSYSNLSNYLKTTKEYNRIISSFKTKLNSVKGSYYSQSGNDLSLTKSNSNMDMYLSIHNGNYLIGATKFNGKWKIVTSFTDTYNFEYWNFAGTFKDKAIVTAVNTATLAQQLGVIKPYAISIFIEDSK